MRILIFLTIVATLTAFASCVPSNKTSKTIEQRFNSWAKRHGKTFANKQAKDEMLKNFERRQKRVDDHNAKFAKGEVSFKTKTWKHSDLSLAEKRARLTGIAPPKTLRALPDANVSYPVFPVGPKSIDWNALGRVTPIRDQGGCGSCWAFGASDLIEAALRKNKTSNSTVSPQQMVDCRPPGTKGCTNGWPSMALQYAKDVGIAYEKDYPYNGNENACLQNKTKLSAKVGAVNEIPTRGNETWLRDIVASVGPVNALICIDDSFFDYWQGVFYVPNCCTQIEHSVTIIGYGTDPKQGDYWLIKNQWSTDWGENGFGRMARNKNSSCNIAWYALWAT